MLITGHASLETSIQALRLGAADYLVKPVNIKQLQGILSRVTQPSKLKAEVADAERRAGERSGHFGQLWGRSPPMQRIYEQISRVAGTGGHRVHHRRERHRQGGRRAARCTT